MTANVNLSLPRPLDLARNLRRPAAPAPEPPVALVGPAIPTPATPEPRLERVSRSFARRDLDRFASALVASLAPTPIRLDSPAGLAAALDVVVETAGGRGRASVMRRPAALSVPEAWDITIDDADAATVRLIDRLARGIPATATTPEEPE